MLHMRRMILVSAGALVGLAAIGVGASLSQTSSGSDTGTPGHGLRPKSTECVYRFDGDAVADPNGNIVGGASTPSEAVARVFPSQKDLTQRSSSSDEAILERYDNGSKVAAFTVRRFGSSWILQDAEILSTSCPDRPGYRSDLEPAPGR